MSSETGVLLLASFSADNSLIFVVLIITASNSLSKSDAVLDSCNSTSFKFSYALFLMPEKHKNTSI